MPPGSGTLNIEAPTFMNAGAALGRGGEGGGAEMGDGVGIVSSVFNVDCADSF